jgi:single stranded DNA-binding protein
MDKNTVILKGHLGGTPEVRTMPGSQKQVAKLSIATTSRWKDKTSGEQRERTEWHKTVCFWPATVKYIAEYLDVGDYVFIEGEIRYSQYKNDKYPELSLKTAEIHINEIDLLRKKHQGQPVAMAAATSVGHETDRVPSEQFDPMT